MHVLTTAEHIKRCQKGCRTINQVTDKTIYMQSYYLIGYILLWLRFSSQFFHQFHLHSQVLQLWLFNVRLHCGRISTWIWYDRYEPSVTGILHGSLQQSTAPSMWNQILCVWINSWCSFTLPLIGKRSFNFSSTACFMCFILSSSLADAAQIFWMCILMSGTAESVGVGNENKSGRLRKGFRNDTNSIMKSSSSSCSEGFVPL